MPNRIRSPKEGWHTSPDLWINQRSHDMCEQTVRTLEGVVHVGYLARVVSMTRDRNNLPGSQLTRVGSFGAPCDNDHPWAQMRSMLHIIQYKNLWAIHFCVSQLSTLGPYNSKYLCNSSNSIPWESARNAGLKQHVNPCCTESASTFWQYFHGILMHVEVWTHKP